MRAALGIMALALLAAACAASVDEKELAMRRAQIVEEVAAMAASMARATGRTRLSDRVMEALRKVERHRFVAAVAQSAAYGNHPLPIGKGQTISQPYIVALSSDLIDPKPDHVVLETGNGSGYQAAVLAELVREVYSIEIVESLGKDAAQRLSTLGYQNVHVRIGDGYQGWPDKAPFDGIIVTAAAPFIPEPLVAQLKAGGKMVIPVDARGGGQELLLEKTDGTVAKQVVLPVSFVPMTGKGVAHPAK